MSHALQFKEETGRKGSEIISGTDAVKPTAGTMFWLLYVITEATFDTGTIGNVRNISGKTFPAGAFVGGWFSQVELSAGSVQAFETDK